MLNHGSSPNREITEKLFSEMCQEIEVNKYDFLQFDQINIDELTKFSDQIRNSYKNVAIIGFGASCLNIRALTNILCWIDKKIIYFDSLDLADLQKKFSRFEVNDTIFLSLSKSGNTQETYLLTQYILEEQRVHPANIYIISPKGSNLLFELGKRHSTNHIEHSKLESGRFGIFSASSLLPSLIAGINCTKILKCAKAFLERALDDRTEIINDAQRYLNNYFSGRKILVTFNYCSQLDGLYRWQQQLIAESLGKRNFGITPVISKGSFDEHSQLQLYLEGPDDKFYNVIYEKDSGKFQKYIKIHANNTYEALLLNNRPAILKNFTSIDESLIAGEIIASILVVMLIAKSQNLNPFDQPSVDCYKIKAITE